MDSARNNSALSVGRVAATAIEGRAPVRARCARRILGLLATGLVLCTLPLGSHAAGAAGPSDDSPLVALNATTISMHDRSGTETSPDLTIARHSAFREFRAAYDAGRYNDALQQAERVVSLTESMPSASVELPIALDNRGAAYYRLGDYIAAEQDFGRAFALLNATNAVTSPRLIVPLQGLGKTYAAAGRHDAAVVTLEHALQISRHSSGLFNPDQLDLLDTLIDSDVALGRGRDADRYQLYAYQVSIHQYGLQDARTIPALAKLARWYVQTRRYSEARELYSQVLKLAAHEGEGMLDARVMGLRGIADTYRTAYMEGSEDAKPTPSRLGQPMLPSEARYYLNDAGRAKLESALGLVGAHQPAMAETRAVLLIELGDWALLAKNVHKACERYSQAWDVMAALGGENGGPSQADLSLRNPLAHPALLLYRRPPAADLYRDRQPEAVVEQAAIAEFSVTADGRVEDATVVEGEAARTHQRSLLRALNDAVYRPQFVDGRPVDTAKVRFRETFRQLARTE